MNCELCGKYAHDRHHTLMGQKKREPKAIRDWLNDPLNLQILCRADHTRVQASYDNRVMFFNKQYNEFGQQFLDWIDSAPDKIKTTTYDSRTGKNEYTNIRYKELQQMVLTRNGGLG